MPGSCVFNDSWLANPEYSQWIARVGDRRKARCKVCLKDLDLAKMGECALKSHAKGARHVQLLTLKHSDPGMLRIRDVLSSARPSASSTVTNENDPVSSLTTVQPHSSANNDYEESVQSRPAPHSASTSEVLSSEILWAIQACMSHFSYRSCSELGDLFHRMFPDSQIAKKFSLGRTKCAYLVSFGLAPYFKNVLLERIKTSQDYVVLFDESLNKTTQGKQLDVYVRYWNDGLVKTRFLSAEFLGHATADDVLAKLLSSLDGLNRKHMVQLSMDGPSVNWKVYDTLQQRLKTDADVTLLNIGSCGLHQVHGAFKSGCDASGWDVEKFLSSLYWLFKDTPARREDYVATTDSSLFPQKFCSHRWLEKRSSCAAGSRGLSSYPEVCGCSVFKETN